MSIESLTHLSTRRLRILWIVLGALLLVSITPLWLYHRRALRLSEDKLQDTERVQQSEITRSLATETLQFEQGLRGQLLSERQLLALTGWIENVDDPTHAPQLSRLLQDFAENNSNILYVTAVGKQAKGQSAGSFIADQDPFVQAALKRAFTSSIQGFDSISEPFALGQNNRPALVVSIPLLSDGQFSGMVAAVVSLEQLQARLRDASVRDRTVYIVDLDGRIVAYPNTRTLVPGSDVKSTSPLAKQVTELPQDLRATQTTNFRMRSKDGRHPIDMIGTYSTIPELRWAVIAQRSLDDARVDAGVTELTSEALQFVVGVTFAALILGTSSPSESRDRSGGWSNRRAQSAGRNSTNASRCAARRRLASSPKRSTTWRATSKSTLRNCNRPPKKIESCSWARSACSPPPSTKKILIRAATPAGWPNIRRSSPTAWE